MQENALYCMMKVVKDFLVHEKVYIIGFLAHRQEFNLLKLFKNYKKKINQQKPQTQLKNFRS